MMCERENERGRGREGEREGQRERERERGREGRREGGREGESSVTVGKLLAGKRMSSEGWAYGVLSMMFELSTSCLTASWWMVDSCIAKIGELGMPSGALCAGN